MPELIVSAVYRDLRNNHEGALGIYFTVGARDVWVTHLARLVIAGNTQPHDVVIARPVVRREGGPNSPAAQFRDSRREGISPPIEADDVILGRVTIETAGISAGWFAWAELPQPVLLQAGISYAIGSIETNGGDWWGDGTFAGGNAGLIIEYSTDFFNQMCAFTAPGDPNFYTEPTGNAWVPPNFFYQFEAPEQPPHPIVDLDPATHAPATAAGNLTARVFARPIGVALDPATFPRVEISSR
jgi:hypothetical protein